VRNDQICYTGCIDGERGCRRLQNRSCAANARDTDVDHACPFDKHIHSGFIYNSSGHTYRRFTYSPAGHSDHHDR
jgi:hypothetical protein